MREYEEYRQILTLWESGIPKKRISIALNIPRGTVHDCIKRFGNLKGLEANRGRALPTTASPVLGRICNAQDAVTQRAYVYILGMYLGDGYIVKSQRIYYLRIFLDTAYPDIIRTCFENVQILLPDNKVNVIHSTTGNYVEVTCSSKFWPDIFPQHGLGMKHERRIVLEQWQQTIVDTYPLDCFRGLYHSDGSRFSNRVKGKDYPRYAFTNNSDDIRRLFCEMCDHLSIHWTAKARYGRTTDIFISKRSDVEYLDRMIGPKT